MLNKKTPSEEFNLPVIGKIRCSLPLKDLVMPIDEFEVIQIKEINGIKVYFCNQWNDVDKVQIVSEDCILEFISYL